MNFHYYTMQRGASENSYILLYAVLNGGFVVFVCLLFAMSGRVFEASKTEDIKETTKILLKALSVVMCIFIYLLQIPMMVVLL